MKVLINKKGFIVACYNDNEQDIDTKGLTVIEDIKNNKILPFKITKKQHIGIDYFEFKRVKLTKEKIDKIKRKK